MKLKQLIRNLGWDPVVLAASCCLAIISLIALRSACANDRVSTATSRWLMIDC